ncbi:MAG TPA: PTS fructose transporter subunit IIA [Gammaproteobacteria bacterium]|nr:PTS fructose transporter subunit IIA [Gammaproteobacteria bacterium]
MSIALFLITHEGIASSLLDIGRSIIQQPVDNIAFTEVPMDAEIGTVIEKARNRLSDLNLNDGILFISDIYGSTPANIARELAAKYNTSLISGVNLPMIIRLLNYRNEDRQTLIEKALDGARQGIQVNN